MLPDWPTPRAGTHPFEIRKTRPDGDDFVERVLVYEDDLDAFKRDFSRPPWTCTPKGAI